MAILGYHNSKNSNRAFWKCGGSLISSRHVITSAQCLSDEELNVVRLGDHNIIKNAIVHFHQDFYMSEKFVHPKYNKDSLENDIAIIKLDREVPFCEYFIYT